MVVTVRELSLGGAVACSCLLLASCLTTGEKSPSPYTLTNTEIDAVENGIRSARPDFKDPTFRGFKAAQHEDGQIDVCGWITPGTDSVEQPFIGTLFAGTFAPERLGGNEVDNAEIFYECRNRRVAI
jgi:hypothetical protein